ncbi:AMP-binding protein [Variovorax boronicumulans]|uniref:AMP-binding protein n=1 Tax=Variovorax boronicumulans TaxID=436515 RepID=UPI003396E6DB
MSHADKGLGNLLLERVAAAPAKTALRFLRQGEEQTEALSYEALYARAARLAHALAAHQPRGSRALLLFDAGIDFVVAFWACTQAGMVAVPAPLPKLNRSLRWYEHIVQDAQIGCVIGEPALQARLAPAFAASPPLRALHWFFEDPTRPALPLVDARGEDLVFLQYTSGSTGAPKGVRVSHRNLLANEAVIQSIWRNDANSVIVSWLPHFHDMGLIGKILQSLYLGAELVLMPPAAFIQRPARWLEAITRYRGTNSGAPNFAYEACLRDVGDAQLAELDLASWQVAWNGAEPVRARTLNAFADRFAACGFRGEALSASYGLAEATLIVASASTGPTPLLRVDAAALQRGRAQVLERAQAGTPALDCATDDCWLVGCGPCVPDHRLRIVDPDTRKPRESGEVGEVWFAGASASGGYWGQAQASEDTCHAHLADDAGDATPYLRTGDLGFIDDADGQLYIVGRMKDMLVIRGANHAPQDIEHSVATSDAAFVPDGCAAFSVIAGGEEQLVVVQELRRSHARNIDGTALLRRVREVVATNHELQLFALCLIVQAHLPKTTSGKVQRRLCRTLFLEDRLESVHAWRRGEVDAQQALLADAAHQSRRYGAVGLAAPRRDEAAALDWLEQWMTAHCDADPDGFDPDLSFAARGIDSAMTVRMVHALAQWSGLPLEPEVAWNYPTPTALAAHLASHPEPAPDSSREKALA